MSRTKVGFVLLSNLENPAPSTRISVINMFPYMRAADYEPCIVFEPHNATEEPDISGLAEELADQGIEIVYFQKVHGKSVLGEAKKLSAMGIKTIFGVCDLVDNEMARVTDATIAVTEYLKNLYVPCLHDKIYVVHDGIEKPELHKKQYRTDRGSRKRPLKAVLVTSSDLDEIPIIKIPPKYIEVTIIGPYPSPSSLYHNARELYWKIRSKTGFGEKFHFIRRLLTRKFKAINWDAHTVHEVMLDADIGIIPVDMKYDPLPEHDVSYWQVKSENRLTMNMCLGLPVIAAPVPSYKEVMVGGVNGYLASDRAEWIRCLEELRDPQKRESIGRKARNSVIERYSMHEQARKLIEVFDALKNNNLRSHH